MSCVGSGNHLNVVRGIYNVIKQTLLYSVIQRLISINSLFCKFGQPKTTANNRSLTWHSCVNLIPNPFKNGFLVRHANLQHLSNNKGIDKGVIIKVFIKLIDDSNLVDIHCCKLYCYILFYLFSKKMYCLFSLFF